MPRSVAIVALWAVVLTWGPGCRSEPTGVRVFAAASTAHVVSALVREIRTTQGIDIETSFASSSMLARQIDRGAHADIFLSANPQWVDYLEERGRVQADTRRILVHNKLVVIARHGHLQPLDFGHGSPPGGRLAIGDPSHVPGGIYAKAALESAGWWTGVEDHLLPALDVPAALAYVELGEADWGIVYATDAAASSKVDVIAEIPAAHQPKIAYPVVLLQGASGTSRGVIDLIEGPLGRAHFEAAGFVWAGGSP